VTLRERDRAMPAETGELGRALLAVGDPYRVIGESLAGLVRDADFADLYEPTGRAAIPPSVLALVTVFQFLEDLPDRQAARAVATRLDWKYALRLPLADPGFDFSALCRFRRRVREGGKAALLFEAVLGEARARGLLKARKQRTDAVAVLAAVRELSRLETAAETLRLAVAALERADPAWARAALPPGFRERHARTVPDYKLGEAERAAALREIGEDGYWLLGRLAAAPAALRGLEAVRVLQTVWEQRFERGPDGAARPRLDGGPPCTERVVSPHDPEARAGRKRGTGWVGEKVHVTETAEPGGPNFITDVATENAAARDLEALPGIRGRLAGRAALPDEQVVDAGYVSGEQLAESEAAGVELVGPPPEDSSPNAFKLADFAIDRAAKCATCPAGVRSAKWAIRAERGGGASVQIRFPAAACAACPLRARCTASPRGRNLSLGEHFERLEALRAAARRPEFKERLKARAAIEGTISELVRAHGLRRHRYRGAAARHCENLLKAAACNLKRLARALAGRPARARAAGAPA
jgi:transposase